jgi:hypothetical protein
MAGRCQNELVLARKPSEMAGNSSDSFHKVETALHDEVCKAHTMTLEEAQRVIATDWLQYYKDKIRK